MLKNIKISLAAKIFLLFAVLYTLLILILSLGQLGEISVGDFHPTDKLMHASAYFGLGFVWFYYLLMKKPESYQFSPAFVKISVGIVLFGMLIEVLQGTLTSYRQPDWADIVANSIGVLVALGVFIFFKSFLRRLKHQISSFLRKKFLH